MRRKFKEIPAKEKRIALEALEQSIQTFSSQQNLHAFVDSVLTESERVEIGRRIAIAQMILKGCTYYEVNEVFSISPNTFSKIRKWLALKVPKYPSIQANTKQEHEGRTSPIKAFSYQDMKRRYPMHFLLFNIAEEIFKKK